MKFYTRQRRTPAVIIVALIDIFAILLIFVIVTTTFKRAQPSVVIKLPESSSAEPAPGTGDADTAVVSVSDTGAIFVDAQEVAAENLTAALREMVAAKRPLALEADTNAPFGIVIRVMDSLKEAGVKGNLPAFTEIRKK